MIRLFVNIDHVATVREARKTYEPDPLKAALLAAKAGAAAWSTTKLGDPSALHFYFLVLQVFLWGSERFFANAQQNVVWSSRRRSCPSGDATWPKTPLE